MADVLNVVLEVEILDSGDYRVHMIGVFKKGETLPPMRYQYRNVVSTWMGVDHNISAFFLEGSNAAQSE